MRRGVDFLLESAENGRWGAPGAPDAGLTAMVAAALAAAPNPSERAQATLDQALDWLVALQQDDGTIHYGKVANYTTYSAVKALARQCDAVIVVGSPNSSNSNRLREVAEKQGIAAYMVDNAQQLDPAWISGCARVGVTAGASAPEVLVQQVVEKLRELGAQRVTQIDGIEERVVFPLPKALTAVA